MFQIKMMSTCSALFMTIAGPFWSVDLLTLFDPFALLSYMYSAVLSCNRPQANYFIICALGTSVTLITSFVIFSRAKNIKYIRVVIISIFSRTFG